jgi:hypothetical protein
MYVCMYVCMSPRQPEYYHIILLGRVAEQPAELVTVNIDGDSKQKNSTDSTGTALTAPARTSTGTGTGTGSYNKSTG